MNLWVLLICAVLGLYGCRPASTSQNTPQQASSNQVRRNALLITVDTLRADRLECYGNPSIKTPAINQLAAEGILFQQTITPVPLTLPAHCSILTGLYPSATGVRDQAGFTLSSAHTTLAEHFKAAGYETGAFVGASVLNRTGGLAQGFDVYSDLSKATESGASAERRGDAVINEALEWMTVPDRKPFFAWIHLFDPHTPYDPPEPYRRQYQDRSYDGEVAYVDSLLGILFTAMELRDLQRNTVVVFTSDHGESLGEHGEKTHGFFLYDSTLRVPLIVKAPQAGVKNRVVSDQVRSIDIAPTLLELLGLSVPAPMQGKSLAVFVNGQSEASPRVAYSESYFPYYHFEWSPLVAMRSTSLKFIKAPRAELYDLSRDPGEKQNVLSERNDEAIGMAEQLQRGYLAGSAANPPSPGRSTTATEVQLRSLGYVGGARLPESRQPDQMFKLADPKDKLLLFNLLEEALHDAEAGRTGESNRKLLQILKKDPRIVDAHLNLGVNYAQQGANAKAIAAFKQVLQLDEHNVVAAFNLALCYARLRQWKEAAQGFRTAVLLSPEDAQPQLDLGRVHLLQGDLVEAQRVLQLLVSKRPELSEAHALLSRVYEAKGMKAEAARETELANRPGAR